MLPHIFPPTASASSIPKATIIDTVGSFPIPLLASILTARIKARQDADFRDQSTKGDYEAPETDNVGKDVDLVQKCLEMVAITRVFDVEGLWEVLGEIGRGSDDGDITAGAAKEQIPQDVGTPSRPRLGGGGAILEEGTEDGTEIIIIDNMTHLINELFARKEKGEGSTPPSPRPTSPLTPKPAHALLATLSRTLHTLSQTANILTILHNSTVSSKPPPSTHTTPTTAHPLPTRPPQPQPPIPPPSLFPSNPIKPALGRIFDQFPSIHLLLSPLPKTREDAEALYAPDSRSLSPFHTSPNTNTHAQEHDVVQYCIVCEVLKDETPDVRAGRAGGGRSRERFGAREQRWAALEVGRGGVALVSAFAEGGGMEAMGLAREGVKDVGSVAKMYGFGGRRV